MSQDRPSVSGESGELVDRLMNALENFRSRQPGYTSAELYLELSLAVPNKSVRTELDYQALTGRLREIISSGISEDFIVCAARDAVTRIVNRLANGIARANENRARMREEWRYLSEHPELWRKVAAQSPEIAHEVDWSDEQIREQLSRLAENAIHDPIDAESAAQGWAALEDWNNAVAEFISDEIVQEWFSCYVWRQQRLREAAE